MIKRDEHGIICQHSLDDPDYMDGGDSLRTTGIMALCGSQEDKALLPKFRTLKGHVRHPYQTLWAEPSFTSRDQVVCGIASSPTDAAFYVGKWKVNKDILDPGVRHYIRKCAGMELYWPWGLLGKSWLFLSLVWNTKIDPDAEMNQFACICIVMGPWWCDKLMTWHPDIFGNINSYWQGWRNQSEIGRALVSKLFSEATKK